jgi:hypothetical protein
MSSSFSPTPAPAPSPPSPAARPPRRRRRPRARWLLLLVIAALVVVYAGLAPWALHIGGRFTPLEEWDGYGSVAASNGGRYLLFTHLRGGPVTNSSGGLVCDGFGHCESLQGQAKLCTRSGRTYTLDLRGAVHGWWTTNGSRTLVGLTGPPLPDGWVVGFSGIWHGPALLLADTDNSFTEVFTPAGALRHVNSTADAGTARVTVRYGSAAAFGRACQQLAAGH